MSTLRRLHASVTGPGAARAVSADGTDRTAADSTDRTAADSTDGTAADSTDGSPDRLTANAAGPAGTESPGDSRYAQSGGWAGLAD